MSKTSQLLAQRAAARIPGGVNSNVRLGAADRFFTHGQGARIWDADGRDFVDYVLGQGPMLLGHANAAVNGAVALACSEGMVFGAQTPLEVEAAERFCAAVPWAERVRFGMTGSEVIQGALRLARGVTGRDKVVRFAGHYHGWDDGIFVDLGATELAPGSLGQPATALAQTLLAPWDDLAALERVLDAHDGDVAAVIMEVVMLNSGAIEASPGYLEGVRRLCTERGVVLVFDEVITGFRLALGGAVERYGVTPDLATYGKALAGGWPVAAFAGRADLMDELATGRINHAGTFNASVMASAAVVATLALLDADPPYARMFAYGEALMGELAELGERAGVPLAIEGLPVTFTVKPAPGSPLAARADGGALLHRALADAGVWTTGRGLWFVSAAHGDEDMQETLARVERALEAVATHEDAVPA